MRLKNLAQAEHQITLFTAPGSDLLLGAVRLDRSDAPQSATDTPVLVPDGTSCVVSVQDTRTRKWSRYNAVVTPNVISLPVPGNLTLLLLPPDEDSSSLEDQVSGIH